MRKYFKPILFPFLVFISCNPDKHTSLNNFVSLYYGKFDLHNKTTADSSGQKQRYIQLKSSGNGLIENGWLLPEAMANNCAIMLYSSDKKIFEINNFLEVKIISSGMEPFTFNYSSIGLKSLMTDYILADTVIKDFISSARSNDLLKAKSFGYNVLVQQEQGFVAFISEFREAISLSYKDPQIAGYLKVKNGNGFDYLIDMVLLSENNQRKWINVSLTKVNNQMMIKEIKF